MMYVPNEVLYLIIFQVKIDSKLFNRTNHSSKVPSVTDNRKTMHITTRQLRNTESRTRTLEILETIDILSKNKSKYRPRGISSRTFKSFTPITSVSHINITGRCSSISNSLFFSSGGDRQEVKWIIRRKRIEYRREVGVQGIQLKTNRSGGGTFRRRGE